MTEYHHSSNLTERIKLTNFQKFENSDSKNEVFRYLGRFDFYPAVKRIIYFILPTIYIILDMTNGLITDTEDVMVEPLV